MQDELVEHVRGQNKILDDVRTAAGICNTDGLVISEILEHIGKLREDNEILTEKLRLMESHIEKYKSTADLWDLLEDDRFELSYRENDRWYAQFDDGDNHVQFSNPLAWAALEELIEEVEYKGWL